MMDKLPTRANPEALHEMCTLLREGEMNRDQIARKSSISDSSIRGNLDYGQALGFLEYDDENDSITATERGIKFGYYDGLTEKTNSLFRKGVREYEAYIRLIEHLRESESDRLEQNGYLDQSTVLREFRIEFNINLSDRQLKSAANTFFQSIEVSGYGRYVVGRGGNPTRLELPDEHPPFFERFVQQDTSSSSQDSTRSTGVSSSLPEELTLPEEGFDDRLYSRCASDYEQERYQSAIQTAFLILEERVREKGGYSHDEYGADLVTQAFSPDSGELSFGYNKGEKQGSMFLYRGAVQLIRNPVNHRTFDNIDRQQAHDILCFVNLLLTYIDGNETGTPDYLPDEG